MRRILFLLGLVATNALSHDLWFEKAGNSYVLYQGHRFSPHAGADRIPYDPSAVKRLSCVDENGLHVLPPSADYPVKITADCPVYWLDFSTGYWTKTAWETLHAPKNGVHGVIKSWYSEESLKYLQRWTNAAALPTGRGLEITPTSDPYQVQTGGKLTLLITLNAQALAGVAVAYAGDTRGVTGADGKISLRLRQAGMQLIQASLETPLSDGKADTIIRSTSLQFKLPQ